MPTEPQPEAEEEMVEILEASRLAGVHTNTLRRWASNGRIPAFRTPGGRLRFRPSDLTRDKLFRPVDTTAAS